MKIKNFIYPIFINTLNFSGRVIETNKVCYDWSSVQDVIWEYKNIGEANVILNDVVTIEILNQTPNQ